MFGRICLIVVVALLLIWVDNVVLDAFEPPQSPTRALPQASRLAPHQSAVITHPIATPPFIELDEEQPPTVFVHSFYVNGVKIDELVTKDGKCKETNYTQVWYKLNDINGLRFCIYQDGVLTTIVKEVKAKWKDRNNLLIPTAPLKQDSDT